MSPAASNVNKARRARAHARHSVPLCIVPREPRRKKGQKLSCDARRPAPRELNDRRRAEVAPAAAVLAFIERKRTLLQGEREREELARGLNMQSRLCRASRRTEAIEGGGKECFELGCR